MLTDVAVATTDRYAAQVEKTRLQSANEVTLAKMHLSCTTISDTKYAQLKQIPTDQRSLADQVKLVIYDGLQQGQQEIEQLRLEAQVSSRTTWICRKPSRYLPHPRSTRT